MIVNHCEDEGAPVAFQCLLLALRSFLVDTDMVEIPEVESLEMVLENF